VENKISYVSKTEYPLLILAGNDIEILRFEPNGDIYLKGNLIDNDKEVVEGFLLFLNEQGYNEPN